MRWLSRRSSNGLKWRRRWRWGNQVQRYAFPSTLCFQAVITVWELANSTSNSFSAQELAELLERWMPSSTRRPANQHCNKWKQNMRMTTWKKTGRRMDCISECLVGLYNLGGLRSSLCCISSYLSSGTIELHFWNYCSSKTSFIRQPNIWKCRRIQPMHKVLDLFLYFAPTH